MTNLSAIAIGDWYYSKRGALCRVEQIKIDGTVTVTSHCTGHVINIPPDQAKYLKSAPEPNTAPGSALVKLQANEELIKYSPMYQKYPHIVPNSIYKVCNVGSSNQNNLIKIDGKLRYKSEKSKIRGAIRCKIKCQICGKTRDIKIQDVFQVIICLECKKKKRKKKLKKFLDKREKNI